MLKEITYILEDGIETKQVPSDQYTVLGKYQVNPWTKKTSYYLRFEGGILINPRNRDERFNIRRSSKLRKVKNEAFKLYLAFLRQHREALLRQAEREL